MKLYNKQPNLTVLLPVNCQASCDFCFWHHGKTSTFNEFLDNLKKVIADLPKEFKQVSISGGEPTTLNIDAFKIILRLLRDRFEKIVLNTNGFRLEEYLEDEYIKDNIDYINLSRHAISDIDNKKIFNTDKVPSKGDIMKINHLKKIRINTVYSDKDTPNLDKWSTFIKETKSEGIAFRRLAEEGTKNKSTVEKVLDRFSDGGNGAISKNNCKVCFGAFYRFKNVNMFLRYSVEEPLDHLPSGTIYEVIVDSSGLPHFKWKNKNFRPVNLSVIEPYKGRLENILTKIYKFLYKEEV